jgi:hypothetical protein
MGDILGHQCHWDLHIVFDVKLADVLLLDVLAVESTDESRDHGQPMCVQRWL